MEYSLNCLMLLNLWLNVYVGNISMEIYTFGYLEILKGTKVIVLGLCTGSLGYLVS